MTAINDDPMDDILNDNKADLLIEKDKSLNSTTDVNDKEDDLLEIENND